MKYFLYLMIIISTKLFSQTCMCWEGNYTGQFETPPLKIISFKSGRQIMVCPPVKFNFDNDLIDYYQDFTIIECLSQKQIAYWYDKLYYTINLKDDILVVEGFAKLPIGINREFLMTKWITEKFYYSDDTVIREQGRDCEIRKYSEEEIRKTLEEYEKGMNSGNAPVDELITKVFVAAISGNDKAEQYLFNFKTDYDSNIYDYLETYDTYLSMFKQWKK